MMRFFCLSFQHGALGTIAFTRLRQAGASLIQLELEAQECISHIGFSYASRYRSVGEICSR
jgi:hypothetical protein